MAEKLRDYQVIDVLCGGTFYKVRHKVTNKTFAWKAYNCCAYSDDQIQNVVNEVKTISEAASDNLLRYYDTILHRPTKTLYLVLEHNSWNNLQHLLDECKLTDKHFAESFVWNLVHELARVCKAAAGLNVVILRKCISPASVFVSESGHLRVNCFELMAGEDPADLMRQVGELVRAVCYGQGPSDRKIQEFHYSDDLRDIIRFLTEERLVPLRPEIVLYHPTVLTHLETVGGIDKFTNILVPNLHSLTSSELNKCDSEKAVELSRAVEPLPRTIFNVADSPIYGNISPTRKMKSETRDVSLSRECLSPTLAALALELPGYVPRSRRPLGEVSEPYNRPQLVSEQTLSEEWMSRLVTLRQREESLNRREKDLIAKEIANSPATKVIQLNDSSDAVGASDSNGITLPAMLSAARAERRASATRRRRRAGSARARRKSCGYEELDSSLSADAGDASLVITAMKITDRNMPRRAIFPEVSTKKVHFTSVNPFTESDDSVTLTFYELDNVDKDGYQVPRTGGAQRDISKFKYLDADKVGSEKRSAAPWTHSSPSKQAKINNNVFADISNRSGIRKTPSKSSLSSRGSDVSRLSMVSARSHWSTDCSLAEGGVFERTRASIRHTLAQTPVAPDMKKRSRKSLIPFKTPFKFMSSNRY